MDSVDDYVTAHGLAWVLQTLRNAHMKRVKRAEKPKLEALPSDKKFNEIIKTLDPDSLDRIKRGLSS